MAWEVFKRPEHVWTKAEERRVLAKAKPDTELAAALGVTVKALQVRRSQLRKAARA